MEKVLKDDSAYDIISAISKLNESEDLETKKNVTEGDDEVKHEAPEVLSLDECFNTEEVGKAIAECDELVKKTEDEVEELKDSVDLVAKSIDKLKTESDDPELVKDEDELDQIKEELDDAAIDLKVAKKEFVRESAKFKRKFEDEDPQKEVTEEDKEDLKAAVESVEDAVAKVEEVSDKVDKMEEDLDSDEVTKIKEDIEKLKDECGELDKDSDELKAKESEIEDKKDQLQESIVKRLHEVYKLKKEAAQYKSLDYDAKNTYPEMSNWKIYRGKLGDVLYDPKDPDEILVRIYDGEDDEEGYTSYIYADDLDADLQDLAKVVDMSSYNSAVRKLRSEFEESKKVSKRIKKESKIGKVFATLYIGKKAFLNVITDVDDDKHFIAQFQGVEYKGEIIISLYRVYDSVDKALSLINNLYKKLKPDQTFTEMIKICKSAGMNLQYDDRKFFNVHESIEDPTEPEDFHDQIEKLEAKIRRLHRKLKRESEDQDKDIKTEGKLSKVGRSSANYYDTDTLAEGGSPMEYQTDKADVLVTGNEEEPGVTFVLIRGISPEGDVMFSLIADDFNSDKDAINFAEKLCGKIRDNMSYDDIFKVGKSAGMDVDFDDRRNYDLDESIEDEVVTPEEIQEDVDDSIKDQEKELGESISRKSRRVIKESVDTAIETTQSTLGSTTPQVTVNGTDLVIKFTATVSNPVMQMRKLMIKLNNELRFDNFAYKIDGDVVTVILKDILNIVPHLGYNVIGDLSNKMDGSSALLDPEWFVQSTNRNRKVESRTLRRSRRHSFRRK